MPQFRKKPVVIDAVEWTGDFDAIRAFMDVSEDVIWHNDDETLDVPTLEGKMKARPGDWIIRGVKGEIYPIKPDIFAAPYESVDPVPVASGA